MAPAHSVGRMTMTLRSKTALASSVAAAVLALSACHSGSAPSASAGAPGAATQPTTSDGDGATPQAAGGNIHPCSLVTQQEATTALGADPGPGLETAGSAPGVFNCGYGPTVGAGVRLFVDASGVGKATYDGDRSSYTSSQATDVPGVGDGAFQITSSASQVTLYFYKGGTFVSITLDTESTTAPLNDKVIALATAAASRV